MDLVDQGKSVSRRLRVFGLIKPAATVDLLVAEIERLKHLVSESEPCLFPQRERLTAEVAFTGSDFPFREMRPEFHGSMCCNGVHGLDASQYLPRGGIVAFEFGKYRSESQLTSRG